MATARPNRIRANLAVFATILAAVACGDSRAVGAATAARPNIVLILADDVGCEPLGCYGGTSYRTPQLGLAQSHRDAFPAPLQHASAILRASARPANIRFRLRHPLVGVRFRPVPSGGPSRSCCAMPATTRPLPANGSLDCWARTCRNRTGWASTSTPVRPAMRAPAIATPWICKTASVAPTPRPLRSGHLRRVSSTWAAPSQRAVLCVLLDDPVPRCDGRFGPARAARSQGPLR